jgi:hypothetical protein
MLRHRQDRAAWNPWCRLPQHAYVLTVEVTAVWSAHRHITRCSCVKAFSGRSAARMLGVIGRCALSCRRFVSVCRQACTAADAGCTAVTTTRRRCQ